MKSSFFRRQQRKRKNRAMVVTNRTADARLEWEGFLFCTNGPRNAERYTYPFRNGVTTPFDPRFLRGFRFIEQESITDGLRRFIHEPHEDRFQNGRNFVGRKIGPLCNVFDHLFQLISG